MFLFCKWQGKRQECKKFGEFTVYFNIIKVFNIVNKDNVISRGHSKEHAQIKIKFDSNLDGDTL